MCGTGIETLPRSRVANGLESKAEDRCWGTQSLQHSEASISARGLDLSGEEPGAPVEQGLLPSVSAANLAEAPAKCRVLWHYAVCAAVLEREHVNHFCKGLMSTKY